MPVADGTHIAWTEATWNPITGCSVVSPGCTNCYAMQLAGTRLQHHPSRAGLTKPTKAGPVWTGDVRFNEQWLDQPLRWTRPRRVFVCAHGDLFHESVPDEWIDRVFAVMALAPQHTFQVLTKRPERMRAYCTDEDRQEQIDPHIESMLLRGTSQGYVRGWDAVKGIRNSQTHYHSSTGVYLGSEEWVETDWAWPLANVWLGVSVEDQERANQRIPILLDTPAAVRWISAEPLLGPIDLCSTKGGTLWIGGQRGCGGTHRGIGSADCPREPHHHHDDRCKPGLDWVVVGGESGRNARPFNIGWGKNLIMQCQAQSVAVFMKQFGSNPVTHEFGTWTSGTGKGTDMAEWPAAMRVQEYPTP